MFIWARRSSCIVTNLSVGVLTVCLPAKISKNKWKFGRGEEKASLIFWTASSHVLVSDFTLYQQQIASLVSNNGMPTRAALSLIFLTCLKTEAAMTNFSTAAGVRALSIRTEH